MGDLNQIVLLTSKPQIFLSALCHVITKCFDQPDVYFHKEILRKYDRLLALQMISVGLRLLSYLLSFPLAFQTDEQEVINFLLTTEIIPLCLRIMESGSELSKTVSTFPKSLLT